MTTTNHSPATLPGAADHDSIAELLPDGSRVFLRPVNRFDIELERQFIMNLSPQSRRFRFLDSMNEPSEPLLRRLTTIDAMRDAAVAATDPDNLSFIGVARFSLGDDGAAEIAVAVSDAWQRRGLGTLLARRLIAIARQRGIRQLYSVDSGDNHGMQALAEKLGFRHRTNPADPAQRLYTLDLVPTVEVRP